MSDPDQGAFAARLDEVLVGGRESRLIEIVDYQPQWPQRFEAERVRIAAALGSLARRIDHVGSTAVPGLAAKPIIDIQVSVDDPDDREPLVAALTGVGYLLRVREPDHLMFRTASLDVHVHCWRFGSADEQRHLLLRDWLRSNSEDRALYETKKRELAGRVWEDMNFYARAKTDTIEAILDRARGVRESDGGATGGS
ncbi:MAG: GrpB family protein [Acidimicrobiia bacterium]